MNSWRKHGSEISTALHDSNPGEPSLDCLMGAYWQLVLLIDLLNIEYNRGLDIDID